MVRHTIRAYRSTRSTAVRRQGFIMMFTLIAIALAGIIMVETTPDFSNYTNLIRSQEAEENLSTLRRIMSQHPFYLTTNSGSLSAAELHAKITALTAVPGSSVPASEFFLRQVPHDPYIPNREWYGDAPGLAQRRFWAASYNFVRNSSFYTTSKKEHYCEGALSMFFTYVRSADMKETIWVTDRFGSNAGRRQVVGIPGRDTLEAKISPDGSRIAFSSDNLGNNTLNVSSVSILGSNLKPITRDTNIYPKTHGLAWSPKGDIVAMIQSKGPPDNDHYIIYSPPEEGLRKTFGKNTMSAAWAAGGFATLDHLSFLPIGKVLSFVFTGEDLNIYVGLVEIRDDGHEAIFSGLAPFRTDGLTAPCFSPNGDYLVFTGPTGNLQYIKRINNFPSIHSSIFSITDSGANITGVQDLHFLPASYAARAKGFQPWILYTKSDGTDVRIYKKNILNDSEPIPISPKAPDPVTIDVLPGSLAVSEEGTYMLYVDSVQKHLYLASTDGSNRECIFDLTADIATATNFIRNPFFGVNKNFWMYAPAIGLRVDQNDRAKFDVNNWRAFTQEEADYPGDTKFGDGWLRLEVFPNQDHFLFTDGRYCFATKRVPKINGECQFELRNFAQRGLRPTFSPRGLTYISREDSDPTGGTPSDCFKRSFDYLAGSSITTVLLTTSGIEACYSPDDKWFAAATPRSVYSTFPPDTTTYPIHDTDIFLYNTTGAPSPRPVNITPNTPNTAERWPAFSPDGKYVFFQRESQAWGTFLGNHASSIFRVTANGGVVTEIVGQGSFPAEWMLGDPLTSIEFYRPSVSPCGTRLAFLGKERLLGSGSLAITPPCTLEVGDIVGEQIFVKDLLFNAEIQLLARSWNKDPVFNVSVRPPNPNGAIVSEYEGRTFDSVCWSKNGEEIFFTRSYPMNTKFPKKTLFRTGEVGAGILRHKTYLDMVSSTEICRVVPTYDPAWETLPKLLSGATNPPMDSYQIMASSSGAPGAGSVAIDWSKISNADVQAQMHRKFFELSSMPGPYSFQRLERDKPVFGVRGITPQTWYILSGYMRTSDGADDVNRAQLMIQLFDNRGLLIAQEKPTTQVWDFIYERGLTDVGTPYWTRFSCAILLEKPAIYHPPPYSMNLMFYSLGLAGSHVEITGIKMERAFATNPEDKLRPTRYSPGWTIFSSCQDTDPRDPQHYLFER